jgi:hypothetical protein
MMTDNHMWATVESYAFDFDKEILPPFIHRSTAMDESGGREVDFVNLPMPIANCKQILAMYSKRTPATRSLIFRTLILEVQRLHNEVKLNILKGSLPLTTSVPRIRRQDLALRAPSNNYLYYHTRS